MSCFWILIELVLAFSGHAAEDKIAYTFIWEQPETKLELKMFEAPISMLDRVGEQGEYTESLDLPFKRQLTDLKIDVPAGEQRIIYIVAKNPGKKDVSFYVAPHHIHPSSASLGFEFRCLCYNHIYKVKAGKLWYRVMRLKTNQFAPKKEVTLNHTLVRHQKTGK